MKPQVINKEIKNRIAKISNLGILIPKPILFKAE